MRTLAFIIIFITCITIGHAQQLRFGLGLNKLTFNDDNVSSGWLLRPTLGYASKTHQITEDILWHFETNLSWKGGQFKYDERFASLNGSTQIKTNYKVLFTYLEFPLIFTLKLNNKLALDAGPYGALLFRAKRKGETTSTFTASGNNTQSSSITFDENASYFNKDNFPDGNDAKRPLRWYDFGFKLGANYNIYKSLNLYGRFSYGLVDLFKNDYPVKNATISSERQLTFELGGLLYIGK